MLSHASTVKTLPPISGIEVRKELVKLSSVGFFKTEAYVRHIV